MFPHTPVRGTRRWVKVKMSVYLILKNLKLGQAPCPGILFAYVLSVLRWLRFFWEFYFHLEARTRILKSISLGTSINVLFYYHIRELFSP